MTKEIKYIQSYLIDNNIDAYIVFTSDDHGSEYIVDYYKSRKFLSGFTGSAGTMVITKNDSLLWTDGRYFIQAAEELKKTNTKLMKMGEVGVPTVIEYLKGLNDNLTVSFDFKCATVGFVSRLLDSTNAKLIDNASIIDEVWTDRPAMRKTKAYYLDEKNAGESVTSKITKVVNDAKELGVKYYLVSSLDDIAWVLNLRGDDITYNPVNYAYVLLSEDENVLYMDKEKTTPKLMKYLTSNGIVLKDYEEVYTDLDKISDAVLIDTNKTNYCLYNNIAIKKEVSISPITKRKAIKNSVEANNLRKCHITDGVAMTKFMYWLKKNVGKIPMTEISVSDKLEELRRENKSCIDLSFNTICGFGSNGAIVHYSANPETNATISKNNLLLVDSGGQYKYGTTDITRTFVLGYVDKMVKTDFTLVLKGNIDLGSAVFPKGTCGLSLDMLARNAIYKAHKDYNHGTGHGVGYLLNVHEGPQSIGMRVKSIFTEYPFEVGMVTSNEPGLYITGEYGIRHENMTLVVEDTKNEFNEFYRFETLTVVPFDLDGIIPSMLTEDEKKWLNSYHKRCYKTLAKYLTKEEAKWLAHATREI